MEQTQEVVLDDKCAEVQVAKDDLSLALVCSLAVTHAYSSGLSDEGYRHIYSAPCRECMLAVGCRPQLEELQLAG